MTLRNFLGLSVAVLAVAGVGCGGDVSTSSGGSGGGTAGSGGTGAAGGATGGTGGVGGAGAAGGTGGTGGSLPTGDCDTSADCGGAACVEVTPGGYKVCLQFPGEATMCNPGGGVPDECCTSDDCADGGKCYLSTALPYCGGPAMAEYNRCVKNECASDGDCGADGVCSPAGAWGSPARVCRTALCKTNADCGAKAGGYCAPIDAPCCSVPSGLACVYPGGCRHNSDCAMDGSKHCEIDPATKAGVCIDGPEACPA